MARHRSSVSIQRAVDGTSPTERCDCRWRDLLAALGCWAAVLFLAACYWATPAPGSAAEAALASNPLGTVEPVTERSLPLVISVLLPAAALILPAIPRGREMATWLLRAFHNNISLGILLVSLAILLALPLFRLALSDTAYELAITVVAALTVLWLFYRREAIDLQLLLSTGFWLLILIVSRQTLMLFPGRVDVLTASWRTQTLFVIHAGAYATALVSPGLLCFKRTRGLLTRLAALPKMMALRAAAALGSATIAASVLLQLGTTDPFRTLLILNTLLLATIVFALVFWASPTNSRADQPAAALPDLPPRAYFLLLGLAVCVFLSLALIVNRNLLPSLNPDGIAYMTIARSYAEGIPVVRGCWSPLISWLLALPIAAGVQPNLAFRDILVLSGTLMMILAASLARNLSLTRVAALLVASSLGMAILASGGFNSLTPDLLGGAIVGLYLWWLTRPGLLRRPLLSGAIAGLLAAFAYYAKYYNIVFVVPHLAATAALLAVHARRGRAAATVCCVALAIVTLMIMPWVLAMKARYGYASLTTTARVSRGVAVRPEFPWWEGRLIATPPDVLFPWEDPDPELSPVPDWSPVGSVGELKFQLRLLRDNLWWLAATALARQTSPLLLVTLSMTAGTILVAWRSARERLRASWLALSILLYVAGYVLSHANEFRFYLTILPLALIAVFGVLEAGSKAVLASDGRSLRLLALFLVVLPSFALFRWDNLRAALSRRVGPCFQEGAAAMAPYLEAPIAGSDRQVNYVSYLTRTRTYGVLSPDTPPSDADAQLRAFGIRTYLAPKGSSLALALTSRFGYAHLGSASMCGADYDILRVPE